MHTLANYFRQTGAEVTHPACRLRAGHPRRARPAPGRALAGARAARRLRRLGHSGRGHRARAPRVRCLPRAAGHGGALRRRAGRARLPDARQGVAHPRPRRAHLRGPAQEFTAGRYHSLFARIETLPACSPGDRRDGRWRGHGRRARRPPARRRAVSPGVDHDPRRRDRPPPDPQRGPARGGLRATSSPKRTRSASESDPNRPCGLPGQDPTILGCVARESAKRRRAGPVRVLS